MDRVNIPVCWPALWRETRLPTSSLYKRVDSCLSRIQSLCGSVSNLSGAMLVRHHAQALDPQIRACFRTRPACQSVTVKGRNSDRCLTVTVQPEPQGHSSSPASVPDHTEPQPRESPVRCRFTILYLGYEKRHARPKRRCRNKAAAVAL